MIYMTDENGNLIPFAMDNQGNNGLQMDLLWQNPNPTNSFEEQSITLTKNANLFKMIAIEFKSYKNNVLTLFQFTQYIQTSSPNIRLSCVSDSGYLVWRAFGFTNNNQIEFYPGGSTVGTNVQGNNDYLIPISIYGIK